MRVERFVEALTTWSARPGSLHQRLSEAIEDSITQGTLLPGMRLPAERSLARALSVSRTTVVSSYSRLRDAGWLESKTGSGTWVSRRHATAARSQAHSGVIAGGSLLNLLQVSDPTIIELAMATPMPQAEFVEQAMVRAGEDIAHLIRQRNYMPFGLYSLRQAIASFLTNNGTRTSADQILITTGGQQAISLISALFVHRGDPVLVENPTYFGALEVFRFAGARLFAVPISRDHVVPEVLHRRIAAVQPRLVYLTPTCQNPTGATLSTVARQQIAREAEEHQVPIIEDECLADLVFRGKRPPAIGTYSSTAPILTVGSLSKLVCSGLRIGWIRGPAPIINRLARLKSAADLCSSPITQAIAVEVFARVDEARSHRADELRAKRDLVMEIIRSNGIDWQFEEPKGGLSLWVRLPGTDTKLLVQLALRNSVTIAPGNLFSVDESCSEYLRLPFLLEADSLSSGVERLIGAWRELNGAPMENAAEAVMV
jgi:DNA-binding transcriptional MocR family regulator